MYRSTDSFVGIPSRMESGENLSSSEARRQGRNTTVHTQTPSLLTILQFSFPPTDSSHYVKDTEK